MTPASLATAQDKILKPEIPQEEIDVQALQELTDQLEARAQSLLIHDDASEEAGLMFIAECKQSYAHLEAQRTDKVQAHNEYVRMVNKAFKPFTDILDRLWRATDAQRSQYALKKQAAIDEANRKAIAAAEAARREEEAKAEAARQEAERLRLEAERIEQERVQKEFEEEMARLELARTKQAQAQAAEDARKAGDRQAEEEALRKQAEAQAAEEARTRQADEDRKAAEAEKLRLEKAAVKLEAKADMAETKALMTAPTITGESATAARTLVSGAKVGSRKVTTWYFENGMAIDGEYYADDPRFKDIPFRYWLLDTAKLGRDVKNGVPVPGCGKSDGIATTRRG